MKTPQTAPIDGMSPLGISQPESPKVTAAELAAKIDRLQTNIESQQREIGGLRTNIEELTAAMQTLISGIQHAATATPPAQVGGIYESMPAVKITRTRNAGKWYYNLLGGRYMKNGVRIWEEGLKDIGLNPDVLQWADDDSAKIDPPIMVNMLMKDFTDDNGQTRKTPQKVIGRA